MMIFSSCSTNPSKHSVGGDNALIKMSRKVAAALFFLTCFDSIVIWVHCATKVEVDQHLQMGMQLIAKGQYSDALSHFHSAIDADPSNYMSYYKRATVFLALSRSRPALSDLDKVIQLKPDFSQARVKRGIVLLKQGRLDEAHIDLEKAVAKEPGNEEAVRAYTMIDPIQQTLDDIEELMKYRNYQPAIDKITEVLEQVPWYARLRELRAEAYMGVGNTIHAISDIKSMTKLTTDNTVGFHKLALLHYQLGESEEALMEIRECLKLDPEHKDCYPFYKSLKKVAKSISAAQEAQNNQDWDECVASAKKVLKNEPTIQRIRFHGFDKLCHCQLQGGFDLKEARKSCSDALKVLEEPRIYCDRADAYLNDEMYDEAVNDYRKALDLDENFQRAKEGLDRAQKRQKQAQKRDYYKILGVKRNARKKEINKAYRKLAQQWHPDNFLDEEEKKRAEKKFMDIAAAKEVLTDKDKREIFDNGEDPLDAEVKAKNHQPYKANTFFFKNDAFKNGRKFERSQNGHSYRFHFN